MRDQSQALGAVAFISTVVLAIRLAAVIGAPFPLNDGGLFYTMISDLISNRFALPAVTTYNSIGAPFAYPPLAFYLYAIFQVGTRLPLTALLQYLPTIVSVACVPAFYVLARSILRSDATAVLATLAFAMVPRAFDWLIMGGGATRSLGLLFALLAMRQAYTYCQNPTYARAITLAALSSLVVYTHPEATTHTAITAAVFVAFANRSRRTLILAAVVAAVVGLLTAPWWGTVLSRSGLDPLLAAADAARADSYNAAVGVFALLRFAFADEPYVTVLSALCLIGVAKDLSRRKYLLPVWLVALHTLEPRGAPLFMMIPFSMSAGLALTEVVLPALGSLLKPEGETMTMRGERPDFQLGNLVAQRANAFAVGFLFVYTAMSAYSTGIRIRDVFSLSAADLRAVEWVQQSTPRDATFAIIAQGMPLRDATSEWFPALTGRHSAATVFGYEWISRVSFSSRLDIYRSLQACALEPATCLQVWEETYGIAYDYVYLRDPTDVNHLPLAADLSRRPEYQLAYNSRTVAIFELSTSKANFKVLSKSIDDKSDEDQH
jgi:hypothetical protein